MVVYLYKPDLIVALLILKISQFNDEDGNFAQGSAQGMAFQSAAGKMVQFSLDEINAGGNKIQEVAEGTADTDAVNVKQLKDTRCKAKL